MKTTSRYIAMRLLLTVPVMLAVVVIVFSILRVAPGNPAQALAGLSGSQLNEAAINHEYGLDQPLPTQFIHYIGGLLHGNLGVSSSTGQPVSHEIADRLPTTLILATSATALAIILGVTFGILAARFRGSWVDYAVSTVALTGLSVPNYVVGVLLIIVFSSLLHLLPAFGGSGLSSFILPVVTVSLVGVGIVARQARAALIETLGEDYVRTAKAKGLPEYAVMWHALRNAMIPVLTVVGLLFGTLVGGTVIVENVFGLNGIGSYMVSRISERDYNAVQGGALVIAFGCVMANLVVDVLYGLLDKRIGHR